jgi:AcrR family transcriptional regulator
MIKMANESERRVDEESAAGVFGFPLEDPAHSLPDTARRIVDAARTLLLQGGFDALRLDAIARESGRNKSAIKYHFGNKDGLILAIVDSLDYDDCVKLAEETKGATGETRIRTYVRGKLRLAGDAQGFLEFFDLLPHVIRDERLRPRVAALYDWYYQMELEWLGLTERVRPENKDAYLALTSLMVAVVDGLALQAALKPIGFDLERALEAFQFFLRDSLDRLVDAIDDASDENFLGRSE